jgi:formylglycine-generating enzyme required for sulfatase activity
MPGRAVTSRYYGRSEELLPKYAWYRKNAGDRTWPVGTLKPNDYGLFDTYGNVVELCQEMYKNYPAGQLGKLVQSDTEPNDVPDNVGRVVRGGSYDYHPFNIRSAYRRWDEPGHPAIDLGFRPARTYR